jgi:hypothetical protein
MKAKFVVKPLQQCTRFACDGCVLHLGEIRDETACFVRSSFILMFIAIIQIRY